MCCYVTRVRLVGSVPGAHTGSNMSKWGHLKLKKVKDHCVNIHCYNKPFTAELSGY